MGKDYDDVNGKDQVIHGVMEGMPAYQPDSFLHLVPEMDGKVPDDYSAVSEPENRMADDHRAVAETGEKTIEDYLALPDDRREELIDGVFYDMAAPMLLHQRLCMMIGNTFDKFIEKNGGKCVPFISPADVQLFGDDKTMVQPDVFVVCDRDKIMKQRVIGAPDLIVEVVSPGSRELDVHLKLLKYRQAGVREYWIVIPDEKKVLVYLWKNNSIADTGNTKCHDDMPAEYTFVDKVPVGIWDGKCEVDFPEIYEKCRFLYEL